MPFKGRTEVRLFDAKTGQLTDRVVSNNIVTSFFDAIFNNSLQRLAKVNRSSGTIVNLFNISNVAVDLFGGVMIFSEKISASRDHVYPTFEEAGTMIGNGNQQPSIVGSTFKGAINATQSSVTAKTVTFVWDFSPEQCNGKIASICLTSNRGGHLGVRFDAKDNSNACYTGMLYLSSGAVWQPLTTRPPYPSTSYAQLQSALYSGISGQSNGGMFIETASQIFTLRGTSLATTQKPSPFADTQITLQDDFSTEGLSSVMSSIAAIGNNEFVNSFDDGIGGVVSKSGDNIIFKRYTNSPEAANEIQIPVVNLQASIQDYVSGLQVTATSLKYLFKGKFITVILSLNKTSSAHPNEIRCYIVDTNGSFVYSDTVLSQGVVNALVGTTQVENYYNGANPGNFGGIVVIDDHPYIWFTQQNYGWSLLAIDMDTGKVESVPRFSLCSRPESNIRFDADDGITSKPFFTTRRVGCCPGGTFDHLGVALMPTYLATINNQSDVLVKTPDKSMQISYTLTQY